MTYWVDSVARGGEVFVPQSPEDPFQIIDARDIAKFAIQCVEDKLVGAFNTVGKRESWLSWMSVCQQVSNSKATFCWANDPVFLAQNLGSSGRPFDAFPLLNSPAFNVEISSGKARSAGLKCRSVLNTVQDILAWQNTRTMSDKECPVSDLKAIEELIASSDDTYWMSGIRIEDEERLLCAWREWESGGTG